jgi:hypothetical protein
MKLLCQPVSRCTKTVSAQAGQATLIRLLMIWVRKEERTTCVEQRIPLAEVGFHVDFL